MIVAVIGSEGFIGNLICNKFLDAGNKVIRISRRLGLDASSEQAMRWALLSADIVYLTAAKIDSTSTDFKLFNHNINIASTCIPILAEYSIPTIIVSSGEVYGNSMHPFKETYVLPNPINFYTASKTVTETIAQTFIAKGADIRIARLFTPYGESELKHGTRIKAIYLWLKALKEKTLLQLYSIEDTRSWTYETDVAEGLYRMINAPSGSVINIAGETITSGMLFNRCLEVTGLQPKQLVMGYPKNNSGLYNCVSNSRLANDLLDWNYKVGIIEGINKIWKYINA